MNTKLKILAILLVLATLGCSTNPVVGKWKAKRTYDFRQKVWTDVRVDAYVEVASDGKFTVMLPGELRRGEYELDETVTPHRFVATDTARRGVSGIYKVEGDKLTIRGTDGAVDMESLKSLDPNDGEATVPIVELAREKE